MSRRRALCSSRTEPIGGLPNHLLHVDASTIPAGAAVALLLGQDLLDVLDLHADAAHVLLGVAHQ